jgi:hypothetical protein
MANPVPYQQLFDIDGLNAAIRDCEATADQFSTAVIADFKRINTSVNAATKAIEALNASMGSRTIKLIDEASQQAIVDYAKQVVALTTQIKNQQAAIDSMNSTLNANKQAISDAKVAAANYATEQQNLKAQQEATKLSIQQQNLFLTQQKGAIEAAKLATQQAITTQQNNKSAISASNLANQQYITTIKQNQAAQSAATLATAQSRQAIAALALANKQAAQAQVAATGSYNEASAKLKQLGNDIKNAKDGFTSTDPALKGQIAAYNELNDKLKAFDASMGNHQRNVGNYKSALGGLQDSLTTLVTGYFTLQGAIAAATKVFDTALETDANRVALQYILGSADFANAKINTLKDTANKTGLEFTNLTRAYDTFTGAAKASNFNLQESDKIFQAVARAAGIMHITSDQTTSALRALSRMMETGTVQARYLQNELGIYIPQATAAMADALGVPISKLHDLERTGGIISSEVLPKFAESLNASVAPGITHINSLQASVNKLKNTFTEAVDENTHVKTFFEVTLDKITFLTQRLLGLWNSTTWTETLARIGSLGIGGGGQNQALSAFANSVHKDDANSGNQGAINDFAAASQKEQLELLKTQTAIRDQAYVKAVKGHNEDIGFYNAQQRLLNELRTIYKDIYGTKKDIKEIDDNDLTSITQIRARISELSKLPGSAIDGSPINNRIDALKKRLHDLSGSAKEAKDGFAVLEEQIQKTMLALQDSIIRDYAENQGKESKNTKQLADAYVNLTEKFTKWKDAQAEDLANAQKRQAFANRGNQPVLTASSLNPSTSDEAAGLAGAFIKGDLSKELNDTEKQLGELEKAYDKANDATLKSYKDRKLTIEQYELAIKTSQEKQSDDEYVLQKKALQIKYELVVNASGAQSTQAAEAYKRIDELEKRHNADSLARDKALYEAKKALMQDLISTLEKSASVVGSVTGNAGLSKLLSDFSSTAVNAFTKDASGNLSGLSAQDAIKDGAQVAIDATSAYTDFAINASKARQAALETEMQYALDSAGTNAEAKKKIEAEYTKKINAEKTKQAKNAKAAAEIEILINTAVAVSKVFAQSGVFGIVLASAIAALGLAELAIVASQPVPQFEKGRESGPATFAEVNEKGPELLVKNGKGRFANKGQRGYTYLQKDEKVIRADDTARFIDNQVNNSEQVSKSKQIYDTYISTHTGKQDIDYERMGNAVSNAVSKLPLEQNVWDERGHAHYRRTANSRIKSVRDRNKL